VRGDLVEARGFLVGTRRLRRGVLLAWVGIVLACAAAVTIAIVALYHWAGTGGVDYGSTVN
jgi:(hydroxyamino)benzene mutase